MATVSCPASHLPLLEGRYYAALTTILPDGKLHTTPVWYLREGENITLNCMREFRKTKNMQANPKVTLLIYDPKNALYNLEIRGTVIEMTEEGALEHLNAMSRHYMQREDVHFFGDCAPAEMQERLHPVRIVIQPIRFRDEGSPAS